MVATAVRIATALGLGAVQFPSRTLLEQETRRRLWFCIGLLDTQYTHDRGGRPLMSSRDFPPEIFPLEVDDEALTGGTNAIMPPQRGWTDMSLCLVTYRAFTNCHLIRDVDTSAAFVDRQTCWNQNLQLLARFETYYENTKCLRGPGPHTAEQRVALLIVRLCISKAQLLLRRPMYDANIAVRPPIDDGFDVLNTAHEILLIDQQRSEALPSPFLWLAWVQWYALAIVLAEMCSDKPHANKQFAWQTAQKAFDQMSIRVADGDTGMLWKPINRLMRKARSVMSPAATPASAASPSTEQYQPLPRAPHGIPVSQTQSYGQIGAGQHEAELMTGVQPWYDPTGMSYVNWETFISDIGASGDMEDIMLSSIF